MKKVKERKGTQGIQEEGAQRQIREMLNQKKRQEIRKERCKDISLLHKETPKQRNVG